MEVHRGYHAIRLSTSVPERFVFLHHGYHVIRLAKSVPEWLPCWVEDNFPNFFFLHHSYHFIRLAKSDFLKTVET